MALAIKAEAIPRRTRRLLESPLTLETAGVQFWVSNAVATGSYRHRELFREYSAEAENVTTLALSWWDDTLEVRAGPERDREEVRAMWQERPAGPASFPGVVALIRDYWLGCHRLNQEVEQDQRVPPWIFLLGWLLDGSHEQCVSVLACMPYWPIGLDREGNWV